jgi:predicted nuclease of predicted toxin-antitoxin system
MNTVRLYIDEDTHLRLAEALRRRGYDAVHAQEVGRKTKSDPEQLEYAVQGQRCVITFNVGDFMRLHREYILANKHHYGILVSPQVSLSALVHSVLDFLERTPETELPNQIHHI